MYVSLGPYVYKHRDGCTGHHSDNLAAPQVVIDLWRQTYHCDILLLVSVYWHSQVFTDMLFIEYQAVSSHSYVPVKFCHKVVHLNLSII